MNEHIYVFGHKSPDTDSICSSIAYARLKNILGYNNAKPYRLGKINKETEFILNYFNMSQPELLSNTKPRAKDLNLDKAIVLSKKDSIKTAINKLRNINRRTIINIIDEDCKLIGVVSMRDIARHSTIDTDVNLALNNEILFINLIDALNGNVLNESYKYRKIEGRIFIGNISHGQDICDKDILITNQKNIENLLNIGFGCIILTDTQETLELINTKTCIITVNETLFKAVSLISQSISLSEVMVTESLETFSEDAYVEDIESSIRNSLKYNFPILNKNKEILGIVSLNNINSYNKKEVILMDHNEKNQTVNGIEFAKIIEIIDHHRFSDISTEEPLLIRAEPVGCTCTIVYKLYKENNVPVEKEIAGLLLSAILSDTLVFASPTCTQIDQELGLELADIAGIDIEKYGTELLRAGTSLDGYTVKEILGLDRKQFTFGKYNIYISQVNTYNYQSLHSRKEEILSTMSSFANDTSSDLVILVVTDINLNGSEVIACGREKSLMSMAFGMPNNENSIFLSNVLSRKKQIVPLISRAITN